MPSLIQTDTGYATKEKVTNPNKKGYSEYYKINNYDTTKNQGLDWRGTYAGSTKTTPVNYDFNGNRIIDTPQRVPTGDSGAQTNAMNSIYNAWLDTLASKYDSMINSNNSAYDKIMNWYRNSQLSQLNSIDKQTANSNKYGDYYSTRNRIRSNTNNALKELELNKLDSANSINTNRYNDILNLLNNASSNNVVDDSLYSRISNLAKQKY